MIPFISQYRLRDILLTRFHPRNVVPPDTSVLGMALFASEAGPARHGTSRVKKVVLVGAVPPLMLKTKGNPNGLPLEVFDGIRNSVVTDRSQFWLDLSMSFYGYNRPGAKISEGVRQAFWRQGVLAGFPASYFCVKAFSETDQTDDLKKFDVPTLIIHGDDDQIVPIQAAALASSQLVKGATLKIYKAASHGLATTPKGELNNDLLALVRS